MSQLHGKSSESIFPKTSIANTPSGGDPSFSSKRNIRVSSFSDSILVVNETAQEQRRKKQSQDLRPSASNVTTFSQRFVSQMKARDAHSGKVNVHSVTPVNFYDTSRSKVHTVESLATSPRSVASSASKEISYGAKQRMSTSPSVISSMNRTMSSKATFISSSYRKTPESPSSVSTSVSPFSSAPTGYKLMQLGINGSTFSKGPLTIQFHRSTTNSPDLFSISFDASSSTRHPSASSTPHRRVLLALPLCFISKYLYSDLSSPTGPYRVLFHIQQQPMAFTWPNPDIRCIRQHTSDTRLLIAKDILSFIGDHEKRSLSLSMTFDRKLISKDFLNALNSLASIPNELFSTKSPKHVVTLDASTVKSSLDHPTARETISELPSSSSIDILDKKRSWKSAFSKTVHSIADDTNKEKTATIMINNAHSSLTDGAISHHDDPERETSTLSDTDEDTEKHQRLPKEDVILKWPAIGKHQIILTMADLMLLQPGEFLNDSIIDFYLKYVYLTNTDESTRRRCYLFSSFFYRKLLSSGDMRPDKMYHRVKSWTKGENLFDRDFLFIPINEDYHWYLAVVCYPRMFMERMQALQTEETSSPLPTVSPQHADASFTLDVSSSDILWDDDDSNHTNMNTSMNTNMNASMNTNKHSHDKNYQLHHQSVHDDKETVNAVNSSAFSQVSPVILLFDSLAGARMKRNVIQYLSAYLIQDMQHKGLLSPRHAMSHSPDHRMPGIKTSAPQQPNSCDCGLFLMHYVETFLHHPDAAYQRMTHPASPSSPWFPLSETTSKRNDLRQLILRLRRHHLNADDKEEDDDDDSLFSSTL